MIRSTEPIIPVCPAKNAEVQALASDTPGGVTFNRFTIASSMVRAPSVLGAAGALGGPGDRRRFIDVEPLNPGSFEQGLVEVVAFSWVGRIKRTRRQFFAIERRGGPALRTFGSG
jgi:hypothetical protein